MNILTAVLLEKVQVREVKVIFSYSVFIKLMK
jgi:hypothetical protein